MLRLADAKIEAVLATAVTSASSVVTYQAAPVELLASGLTGVPSGR